MGVRSSKVAITLETKPSADAPESAFVVKPLFENGNHEAIPSIDESASGPSIIPTDETNGTIHIDECPDSKKKKNPINWITKKMSLKMIKTPKKAHTNGEATVATETAPEKLEVPEVAVSVEAVQTQAEEVSMVDQGTEKNEQLAELATTDPIVVEIVPTENGVEPNEDGQYFEEAPQAPQSEEHKLKTEDTVAVESDNGECTPCGLAEKVASLGIDSIQPGSENGLLNGEVFLNGDVGEHHEN